MKQFKSLKNYSLTWASYHRGKVDEAYGYLDKYKSSATKELKPLPTPDLPSKPFCFNGIDGNTGDYVLNPMNAQDIFDIWRGVDEPDNLPELKKRVHDETEKSFGVTAGVDSTKLDQTGWGIIFPFDENDSFVPAVKDALQPLLDLRKEQTGHLFRIYEGPDAVRSGESKRDF